MSGMPADEQELPPLGKAPENLRDATLADEEIARCPWRYYAELRDKAPVRKDPAMGYYWVTRRTDVAAGAQNSGQLSSGSKLQFRPTYRPRAQKIWDEAGMEVGVTLLTADPPEHEEFRRWGNQLFTPKKVNQLTAKIQGYIDDLIDMFMDKGKVEFTQEFAALLPAIIVAGEYGLERKDVAHFKHWADSIIHLQTPGISEDEEVELVERVIKLFHYLMDHLQAAAAKGEGGIMYDLATATRSDGEPFSWLDKAWTAMLIFIGGNDTTANLLSSALLHLCDDPKLQDELRADPAKIPAFLEEMLRLEGPVQAVPRVAKGEVEIEGTRIPDGADVMLCTGSANRDPEYWEDPEAFRLDRPNPRQHMAFGYGRHVCVGMHLARRELQLAFETLLRRLHNIRLDPDHPRPNNLPMPIFRGLDALHVRFDPAP